MTAPVIRGTCGLNGGAWTVAPQSGDFLVFIGSIVDIGYGAAFATPSGWTAYPGLNTENTRVWTKTATGSEPAIGLQDFGYINDVDSNSFPIFGAAFAFSNGANTSIDYAAGTLSSDTSIDGGLPTAPPPKNNTTLATADGLLISIGVRNAEGYYFSGYLLVSKSNISPPSGMTSVSAAAVENVDRGTYADYDVGNYIWKTFSARVAYQQLSSSTNPGSKTFPSINYLSDGLGGQSAASIVIKVATPSGPTAYGPSIRR